MLKKIVMLLAPLVLAPALAPAEENGGVELKSRAELEVVQQDQYGGQVTQRVPVDPENAAPGNTVCFTIEYLSGSEDPAANLVLTNPIPRNMRYLDTSAQGEGVRIDFSTDNGKTFGDLPVLTVNQDGELRTASAADVTNIRWVLEKPLEKGVSGSVTYRARVK